MAGNFKFGWLFAALLGLASCALPVEQSPRSEPSRPSIEPPVKPVSGRTAVRNFIAVVEAVEPVAEQVCRFRAPQLNCDFQIVVDTNPKAPANAFQTVDDAGQPVIAFTVPLIVQARNRDELAFIMAHEAAHHIQGHIDKQARIAVAGARLFGGLAAVVTGGREASIRAGQQIGAQIGARTYSKDFELEADALGTLIAHQAGYDPLLGSEFFFRIPDPGDQFLGSHPANGDRLRVIRQTAAAL